MTVSESVIKWLKTFDPEEYRKMGQVDTEIQSAEVDSYSLVKEPVRVVKKFITGKEAVTEHYTLQARLSSQTNTDCIENNGFGEALEKWVAEQNEARIFPEIPDAIVKGINITTPFYLGRVDTDNSSIYQLTVAVSYEKQWEDPLL